MCDLNARGKTILFILKREAVYLDYLRVCIKKLIQPLQDLSKGAKLGGGGGGGFGESIAARTKGLFDTKTSTFSQLTEGYYNRFRTHQQSCALETPEMAIFLRTFPQLEAVTNTLVLDIEGRMKSSGKGEVCVGDVFLDLKQMGNTYNSYASCYEEALAVLNSNHFADYCKGIAHDLMPLTLEQHLQAPFDAMKNYNIQLAALLELTPKVRLNHQ